MKLFGDSGKHLHTPDKKSEAAGAPEKKPKKTRDARSFFHAPIWKKLRVPAIILAAVVILALLAVLVYSIWERPPAVKQTDGPTAQTAVKPAVEPSDPVPETAKPVVVPVIPAETPAPSETPEPSAEPTETPEKTGRKEDCYTFVVLAYDQTFSNTDTILIGRLDTKAGTLDMVNIPRDTLVNVSWGVKKVNTILPLENNEPDRFMEHLGNLIGFTPDCYAIANIRAVEKLVDCIGGVYYNVRRDMDYDDPSQDLHIHIPAGYQLLNGENAVKVMRFRMGNDYSGYGDLGRIETQQDFLMSAASQFLKLGNIPNLSEAIQIIQDNFKTDLTANNIAFFAREFLKLDKENIHFYTMPARLISIRGGSYLEVVVDEWIDVLDEALNPFYQSITVDNLNILQDAGEIGAISTTGEVVPLDSFLDFRQYLKDLENSSNTENDE